MRDATNPLSPWGEGQGEGVPGIKGKIPPHPHPLPGGRGSPPPATATAEEAATTNGHAGDASYWERALAREGESARAAEAWDGFSLLGRCARRVFCLASRVLMRSYLHQRVEGLEHLPRGAAFILVANHSSHLDTVAVQVALDGAGLPLRVIGARDYFFNAAPKAWFFHNCVHVLPLDREEDPRSGLLTCREVLARGTSLLVFPEGTRSPTGRMGPFKAGAGILALELDVPLVPVAITGTFAALPKGRRWPRHARVTVRFGAPLSMSRWRSRKGTVPARELYREIMEAVRQEIIRLLPEEKGPEA